ncbi:MAG: UbiA family prenyltransferase [Patescibacteria group bacterium]|nr:UbiA family prenyltransferase [Patescibacteria group bacterium]
MPPMLRLMRPYSWIKNFFIFVPLFFAKDFFVYSKLTLVTLAFIVFCLTASSVYILNDIFDKEQDQKHSTKKNRPIASGAVSIKSAIILLCSLLIVVVAVIYFFIPQIFWLMVLYFLLNVLYSKYFKHIAILDILLVSTFYFIRIMVGGIAAMVPISNWLLLCIIFISLFLIVAKRLAEFSQDDKRIVLLQYTPEFLNAMLIISATLVIIAYSLYSVLVLNSNVAVFSIFLVILGIVRYLFLVFTTHKAEYPEKVIIADKVIFLSSLAWILTMFFIIYLHI